MTPAVILVLINKLEDESLSSNFVKEQVVVVKQKLDQIDITNS